MKGILLAAFSLICYFAVSVPFLRGYQGRKPYKVIQASFVFAVMVYILLFRSLPDNLGFLPQPWLEPNRTIDLINGILLLALLYNPYLVVYYCTSFNGLSTQILVFLHERGTFTAKELLDLFGVSTDPQKEDPTTAWRLTNLLNGGYVERSGAGYHLRWKGRIVAKLTWVLKRIVSAGDPGG